MADFYENLSQMENEAMRRARHIHEAERRAARRFQQTENGEVTPAPPPHREHTKAHGLPDLQGFEGEISERPYIQSARAGQTWQGGYAVEVF